MEIRNRDITLSVASVFALCITRRDNTSMYPLAAAMCNGGSIHPVSENSAIERRALWLMHLSWWKLDCNELLWCVDAATTFLICLLHICSQCEKERDCLGPSQICSAVQRCVLILSKQSSFSYKFDIWRSAVHLVSWLYISSSGDEQRHKISVSTLSCVVQGSWFILCNTVEG